MKGLWRSIVAGMIFATAMSSVQAQTIACSGVTAGNCIPVVNIAPAGAANNTITFVGNGAAGYPAAATPITGVFSGANTTTASATLAGTSGKFTYIAGFSISGLGSTAGGTVIATVATVTGGNTLSYSYVFTGSATTPNTPVSFTFNPPIPASAAAGAITVTVPGSAGNTATQINAWGYQQ